MTHRIKSVKPTENLVLFVRFQNGIEKKYNVRKLFPVFPEFQVFDADLELFYQVQVDVGGYGISQIISCATRTAITGDFSITHETVLISFLPLLPYPLRQIFQILPSFHFLKECHLCGLFFFCQFGQSCIAAGTFCHLRLQLLNFLF